MEGYFAEIRCFSGNFAPKYWAFCWGQTLPVSTNQALFALLYTTFGGNGMQTFQLPDFRSRVPVGTGVPSYNTNLNFVLGQKGGEETHTLITSEMTMHTHGVTVVQGTGAPVVGVTLNGTASNGNTADPQGALLAHDDGSSTVNIYANASNASAKVAMAPNSVTLTNLVAGIPTVNISPNGGNQPHNNIQPVLGMHYVICTQGIFPSRN
ncbi:phage tail protein [Filimonas effusa]|uniref:Phage tail protein n=1 Tax=Filimonas effusa TaxID=2508721 RepID=A0A4Q1DAN5_9BACT|nr:tail fiber protein [Filimonas effusa]RXK85968.1 phage tail protein [Filimonas effusa]